MDITLGVSYIVTILIAYLLGSIPMGIFVVRLFRPGVDIRQVGSGRTGGTNAARAGGWQAGVMTGLCDALKGFGAVYVARLLFPTHHALFVLEALCGIAAVAGHNWSIYIGFKGGAGTGPNIGAATALWGWTALFLAPAVPIILLATGYASVASTSAAFFILAIMLVRWLLGFSPFAHVAFAIGTTILVCIALIPNYRRLLAGEERVFGPRAKAMARRGE